MDIRLGRKKMMIVNDYQREAIKTDKWFDHDPTSRLLKAHIGLNLAATKLYDLIKRPLFRNESLDKAAVAEQLGDVAWYGSSSTHAVAEKTANALGLYDMSGNVWEWCSDGYGSYSSSPQTNPTGASSDPGRVLRGASYYSEESNCRSANRGSYDSTNRYVGSGLRLAY